MIKAEIIADSKNLQGDRITTMIVTLPRIVLAEFNTHRMFSRNSASSRAIPFDKMVESVQTNPFIPMAWQKDHKGMQGTEYLDNKNGWLDSSWLVAGDNAIYEAKDLHSKGATKQLCNRLLEPFMYHTVIVTATEWENFFHLRCPQYTIESLIDGDKRTFRSKKDLLKELNYDPINPDSIEDWLKTNQSGAEIHIQALAELMYDALNESTPKELKEGEWHIPFEDKMVVPMIMDLYKGNGNTNTLDKVDYDALDAIAIKVSTAMCARVSYTVVGEEGKSQDYAKDVQLHDRLSSLGHWSPFEHCAKAMSEEEYNTHVSGVMPYSSQSISVPTDSMKGWSGNFKGFVQYRKTFLKENVTK